jgi:hypothetical protein
MLTFGQAFDIAFQCRQYADNKRQVSITSKQVSQGVMSTSLQSSTSER